MSTYRVGTRRLHLAAWSHGVSMYGWEAGRDGGFVERHAELMHGKGTLRLRADDLAEIEDEELTHFFRSALAP